LAREVESLRQRFWPQVPMRTLNSMLHMRPEALALRLREALDSECAKGLQVVLIYGDCCVQMGELERWAGVVRTAGKNCVELLLGAEGYRALQREEAFVLLPEWTHRWREVFALELGLTQENATTLMKDMHQKLVYLDTGVQPVPDESLTGCGVYCGLPCEVRPSSLDMLHGTIQEAMGRLRTRSPQP
jgi:hypothetical protein